MPTYQALIKNLAEKYDELDTKTRRRDRLDEEITLLRTDVEMLDAEIHEKLSQELQQARTPLPAEDEPPADAPQEPSA